MKKLLMVVTVLLTCMSFSYANDFGLSGRYSPTADEFVRGTDGWVLVSESASAGLYGRFLLFQSKDPFGGDGISLTITDRLIFGTDTHTTNTFLTGNKFEAEVSFNDFFIFNYEFYSFFDNSSNNIDPSYLLQTGYVHKFTIDLHLPLFKF